MTKRPPNKFIAPIVIAGITAGFFVSAYKFVFAKPKPAEQQLKQDLAEQSPQKNDEK
ncbi:hypothetical protein [Acinetobacter bouvetii]|uniref:Uncharacterized protein n=1 Tax=Acinetobacter bouvetii TaxID=202951 RepID=A0A811GI29_9GAMM|nr:hypothetical protein [Acinetobacter bouvetii]CAB1222578.1 hypothetical protein SFB21_3154 [Acinetobacter bouvetii]